MSDLFLKILCSVLTVIFFFSTVYVLVSFGQFTIFESIVITFLFMIYDKTGEIKDKLK